MKTTTMTLLAAGLIGLSATPSFAALSGADRNFADKAAAGGLAEVQLGQLAQQKAASPTVKQFGQRMVTDHSQANQALEQIAKQQNLTLPTQPDSQQQATIQRLQGLSGTAFDSAYTQDMVTDHHQDIADFQKEANSGQDPQLKAFAQKYLPVLQQHLQLAQAAEKAK
jgi:putative membrane protein